MTTLFLCSFACGVAALLWLGYARFLERLVRPLVELIEVLVIGFHFYAMLFVLAMLKNMFLAIPQAEPGVTPLGEALWSLVQWLILVVPAMAGYVAEALMALLNQLFRYAFVGVALPFYLPVLSILSFRVLYTALVPHPAEAVVAKRGEMPRETYVREVKEKMYVPKRDGLFAAWKAEARQMRLRETTKLMREESELMEEIIRNLKLRERLGRR